MTVFGIAIAVVNSAYCTEPNKKTTSSVSYTLPNSIRDEGKVTLIYAVNDGYAVHAAVSIHSFVYKNAEANDDYQFIVLCDGEFTECSKALLKKAAANVKLVKIPTDINKKLNSIYSSLQELNAVVNKWNKLIYIKCFLPDIFKNLARCYWIDADTVASGKGVSALKKTYNTKIWDVGYIGANHNNSNKEGNEKKKRLYGGGVILFDCEKFRENKISEHLVSTEEAIFVKMKEYKEYIEDGGAADKNKTIATISVPVTGEKYVNVEVVIGVGDVVKPLTEEEVMTALAKASAEKKGIDVLPEACNFQVACLYNLDGWLQGQLDLPNCLSPGTWVSYMFSSNVVSEILKDEKRFDHIIKKVLPNNPVYHFDCVLKPWDVNITDRKKCEFNCKGKKIEIKLHEQLEPNKDKIENPYIRYHEVKSDLEKPEWDNSAAKPGGLFGPRYPGDKYPLTDGARDYK
jgi:hypothetical protein